MSKKICLVCECSSEDAPLIKFYFKDEKYAICAQHLPILIHKPQELAGKLPQSDQLSSAPHHHGGEHHEEH